MAEEILQQETQETPQEETQEQPAQQAAAPEPQKSESDKEKNLRILREEKERLAKEAAELRQKLSSYEVPVQAPQPEDDDIGIKEDDLAEGRHLKKMAARMRKMEEQIKSYQEQSTVVTTETRIKATYPDFDTVVNNDTVAVLRETYPEVAASITNNQDLYTKAVSAYTLIKKLGIYQDPNQFAQDRQKVQTNAAKPRPLASVSPQQGDSPLSHANAFANGLTDDLRKQLWKEMQDSSK